jgi:hypothetical protein
MSFIKHTEVGKRFLPRVSMSQGGLISFSDAATKRFGLDRHGFVVLYYDPDTKRVGIELTNEEKAAGAIKIRLRSTGAYVAGKSFVGKFDIKLSGTTAYDVEIDEESQLLVFDLNKGAVRLSSNSESVEDEEE